MTKELFLHGKNGKGKRALVDDDKYDECHKHHWWMRRAGGYPYTTIDGKVVELQDFVTNHVKGDGFLIDHVDGNHLNNVCSNLRKATVQQNAFNMGKAKDNSSGYKGVSQTKTGKWRARITLDGKQKQLGVFNTPQEAAMAYDLEAKKTFAGYARLNFPDWK